MLGAACNTFSWGLFACGFLLVVVFSVVSSVTLAVLSVFVVFRSSGAPRGICRSAASEYSPPLALDAMADQG